MFKSRETARNQMHAQCQHVELVMRRRVFDIQRARNEMEWQKYKVSQLFRRSSSVRHLNTCIRCKPFQKCNNVIDCRVDIQYEVESTLVIFTYYSAISLRPRYVSLTSVYLLARTKSCKSGQRNREFAKSSCGQNKPDQVCRDPIGNQNKAASAGKSAGKQTFYTVIVNCINLCYFIFIN